MTRRTAPPAAPAAKKKKGGHGFLRLLLGVAVLAVFVLVIAPTRWFGEWINTPRNAVAVVGAVALFAAVAVVLVGKHVQSDRPYLAALAVATVLGGVLWAQDAGSAAVRAGMMDCPKPLGHVAWVDAPGGTQCVKVPRCSPGRVPTWQADKVTPTGQCVNRRATR